MRNDLIVLNLDKISPQAWEEIKNNFKVIMSVDNFPDKFYEELDQLQDKYFELINN